MNPKPLVIIVNYRQSKLTAQCVSSFAGQVEHICVIDNSATDLENQKLYDSLSHLRYSLKDIQIDLISA
jgi:GT2 family glycosyltransferase